MLVCPLPVERQVGLMGSTAIKCSRGFDAWYVLYLIHHVQYTDKLRLSVQVR
jgi:hypothetical protein